jgi:MarR family transcriptional regulator, negative regulator of the multidrug operon emrRAB
MNLIGCSAGTSIQTVAENLALSHSATVRLIDKLATEGFVHKSEGRDGRNVPLELSAQKTRPPSEANSTDPRCDRSRRQA